MRRRAAARISPVTGLTLRGERTDARMISPRPEPSQATVPGWAAMPVTMRAGTVAAVLLGLATLAVQVIALLSAGSQSWATADLAWTLAGVVTLVATLAAGLRVGSHRAVRAAWQLYAAAAGCWIVGALIRDSATTGHLGTAADLWQLAFPLFCILSFARRVPRAYIFVLFMLDAIPVILLILAIIWTVEVGAHSRPLVLLYPALYVLLAANAIQTIGMHQDLRRVPGTVWLFTLGFCTMALASLFWGAVTMRNGSALAHWACSASGGQRASSPCCRSRSRAARMRSHRPPRCSG
jgi:hypothetical protein